MLAGRGRESIHKMNLSAELDRPKEIKNAVARQHFIDQGHNAKRDYRFICTIVAPAPP